MSEYFAHLSWVTFDLFLGPAALSQTWVSCPPCTFHVTYMCMFLFLDGKSHFFAAWGGIQAVNYYYKVLYKV